VDDTLRKITLETLRAAREGDPVIVATIIIAPPEDAFAPTGAKLLVRADATRLGSFGGGPFEDAVAEDGLAALNQFPRQRNQAAFYLPEGDRIHRLEARGGVDAYEVMIELVEAPMSLLIVGGGHIGLSLATIGAHVGYSVAVLDDREMYANAERFPMADKLMCGDFTELLAEFPINLSTAIVLVSRGHKQDETALRAVVTRGAGYLGMIGSKRRVSTVLRHLAEEGYPLQALEAVYTPIGFDIGAETPEEIAVSIMAEIIAVRHNASGHAMREGRPSIGAREPETTTAD
jgi:xanthine dehydrogenase accessory factor